jgi:hypothetical protein
MSTCVELDQIRRVEWLTALCPCGPRLCVYLSPHFDDQPRRNDSAECSERSYDYAKDKLTRFAPFRLYRCVLKARILLRKPLLSLDTLFSRKVSHVARPQVRAGPRQYRGPQSGRGSRPILSSVPLCPYGPRRCSNYSDCFDLISSMIASTVILKA